MDYVRGKLGKLAPKVDEKTLKLADYLKPASLPPAPAAFDATANVPGLPPWGMLANDSHGDCTCAAACHMSQLWKAQAGHPAAYADADALNLYARVNGGGDNGAVELDVLNEWRKQGIDPADKIDAFARINQADLIQVRQGLWLFSGLYIGVALPLTARQQPVWDVAGPLNQPSAAPGSWGGHAVNVIGYDPAGLTIVTWGATKRMTWAFWTSYVDEAWAVLPNVADVPAKTAAGFDFAGLQVDLADLGPVNPSNG